MYQETKLNNGLIVATERVDSVKSAAVGVFVNAGSRHETAQNNGVAHFLEHMAFKGTESRSALDIAKAVEDVGGYMNAYTSRETTAYYLKVMAENVPLAVDILADIMQHSTFVSDEMERERGVILQEIGQTLDTPDEVVFENLQELLYKDQALGRSILGTQTHVREMRVEDLRVFMSHFYTCKNMYIVASGLINHDDFVAEVAQKFNALPEAAPQLMVPAQYKGGFSVAHKPDLEQVHMALAWEAMPIQDPLYYAAHVWNMALGGGMASRLFQEVREKRGLAYSVFSFLSNYDDSGSFGVYAGTSKDNANTCIAVMKEQVAAVAAEVSDEEIQRAKTQMRASLVMSQESTDSRMRQIASDLMTYGRRIPLDEVLAKIDAVNNDTARQAAENMTQSAMTASIVGPMTQEEIVL